MTADNPKNFDLAALARDAMRAKGFEPDIPADALAQAAAAPVTVPVPGGARDLRSLPWSSIDNDNSRDLDQIEFAEKLGTGRIRVLVGIADVDSRVAAGTPADRHAGLQTATIYTDVTVFPMLPERFSTELTSLAEGGDRLAIVVDMVVNGDGDIESADAYPAQVRNRARLTYSGVGPWLEGRAGAPPAIAASPDLEAQLRLQNDAALLLLAARHRRGALSFDRAETQAVVSNGKVTGRATLHKNRAGELIEDFMVAANQVMARKLREKGVTSIRRVVRAPERWDRIAAIAQQHGYTSLPPRPDVAALNAFLTMARPLAAYHDISLAVLKLLGPGEYAMEPASDREPDHFSLAAIDYTHSTAPNRRFADIVTQRILKAVVAGAPPPYTDDQLAAIARRCTLQEDAARKVERLMDKRLAAAAMADDVGREFAAVVTGVTPKGTFVKVFDPPAEGLLRHGEEGADVGDRIRVRLTGVNVPMGFVDFARVG